jgi:hypothetical protein
MENDGQYQARLWRIFHFQEIGDDIWRMVLHWAGVNEQ